MSTIDERGRAAATALRDEMTRGFDVEAGLDEVLRGEPIVHAAEPDAPRRGWMLAAASVLVLAVGAVAVLALRDEPGAVSDTPSPGTTMTPPPVNTAAPDTTIVPDEAAETTLVADTAVDTTVQVVERTVRVADVVQVVEPRRTVLATPGFGSGPGDLGVEDCQECDPARPWSPIAIPSGPRGKVLIADAANGRWMMFEPENPDAATSLWSATETPWPDGVTVSSQPVVDQAGTVYAMMYGPLGSGGTNAYELWTLDSHDLAAPTGRHLLASAGNVPIILGLTTVSVGGQVIEGLTPSIDQVSDATLVLGYEDVAAVTPPKLLIDVADTSTTFIYELGEAVEWYGPNPALPDSSVLLRRSGIDGEIVDRLFLDGRVLRIVLPPVGSVFGAAFANQNGFVRLEVSPDGSTWEIARYELPGS